MSRRLVGEALGTALLLAAVVGSGIMGERLASGNRAIALLANTLATGAALVVLILVFGPVSGAHFNPVVTLAAAFRKDMTWPRAAAYVAVQVLGAVAGVLLAHAMFGEPLSFSRNARAGVPMLLSEAVATFGLLLTILGCARRPSSVPFAVGLYITAAYWFTASTSFANPAVTIARSLTDTFTGIRPQDAPGFIAAQLAGGAAAAALFAWLDPKGAPMKTVLFACVHNAGRSQMAAALFNREADPSKARAVSAGTQPGDRVHPVVADALQETGIDVSGLRPRLLTPELAREASLLVTMGCGETCPHVPGLERLDWPLEDPKGKPIERVREIRDEVARLVRQLVVEKQWAK